MTRAIILLALAAAAAVCPLAHAAEQPLTLESDMAVVFYPHGLESDARSVLDIYKDSLTSVESRLGMRLGYRASIVLVKDSALFRQASGSPDIVAFARAVDGLIVIDYRRALVEPFTLSGTMKHEAVHLLLGEHIGSSLPRWLNEGMAQYASESPAEIALSRNASVLSGAALSDGLIPFERLVDNFPHRRESLVLAYEQSLSFVQYIAKEYGERSISDALSLISQGVSYDDAISRSTGVSFAELETRWSDRLRAKASWISFFSDYFYELIFVLGALITLYAAARAYIRIRTYKDEPDEPEPHPTHRFPFEEKHSDINSSDKKD